MSRSWLGLVVGLQLTLYVAAVSKPYCDLNQTDISFVTVIKTRLEKIEPKGVMKMFKKSQTRVVEYKDREPVIKRKLVRGCCEGYEMSHLGLCEPVCKHGCPKYASCIEPSVCKCRTGYVSASSPHDGTHYCEPICGRACPDNSVCVAPNECACQSGYRMDHQRCVPSCRSGCPHKGLCVAPEQCECQPGYSATNGTCVPICTRGDGCRNGKCVSVELCVCNVGYNLNRETGICERNVGHTLRAGEELTSSTLIPEVQSTTNADGGVSELLSYTSEVDLENSYTDDDLNIDGDGDDDRDALDSNESDDLATESSTEPPPDGSTCPPDHVYYRGNCRPVKFSSDEIDCRVKPCDDAHSVCAANGTCSCISGYVWYRPSPDSLNSGNLAPTCLTLAQVQARLNDNAEIADNDLREQPAKESGGWAGAFFIALGIVVIVAATVFLLVRLLNRHRGHMDVQGKDLACVYENKASGEGAKVQV